MTRSSETAILERIQRALELACGTLRRFTPGIVRFWYKSGGDPVTQADHAVNETLREYLVRDDDGWLSEEQPEDLSRLQKRRVWIVDPLDGTREFVQGIPEWCVSVALVEHGVATAGGICNPATHEFFVGAKTGGVVYNGNAVTVRCRTRLSGSLVLGSRNEFNRGEWKRFESGGFQIQPMGSVAYKLARVAAGLADATWTLVPKHEWDVAGGTALVQAAGGVLQTFNGQGIAFNRRIPLFPGLVACSPGLYPEIAALLKLTHAAGVVDSVMPTVA